MSGGPWIAPSNAMRNLTYSRMDVVGGKPVKLSLPVPDWQMESRLKAEDLDYRDLFVLAFPTPAGDTPDVQAMNGSTARRFTTMPPERKIHWWISCL